MIVSHKKKFIFVHIPRTGGTIISKNICKSMGINNWKSFIGEPKIISPKKHKLEPKKFERKEKEGYKHATAKEIKSRVDSKIWESYFKFSFVRNPWDRTVSMYFKKRKESPNSLKALWPKRKIIFTLMLITRYKILDSEPHQQVESLETDDGPIDLDFIGKYEKLEDDYKKVCEKLGLDSDIKGTHDKTNRRGYEEYYNRITKNIIYEKKKRDCEKFGYSF